MFLRIHRSMDNKEVVGICDRELIGQTLTEGDVSVQITESFFGNRPASEEEIIRVLNTSDNISIFGKRCIDLAIDKGFLEEESCRIIAGVPCATIIRI